MKLGPLPQLLGVLEEHAKRTTRRIPSTQLHSEELGNKYTRLAQCNSNTHRPGEIILSVVEFCPNQNSGSRMSAVQMRAELGKLKSFPKLYAKNASGQIYRGFFPSPKSSPSIIFLLQMQEGICKCYSKLNGSLTYLPNLKVQNIIWI